MLNDLQQLFLQMGKENMDFYLKASLEPIRALAEKAGLLEWTIPIISVTGTNGKGSTVAALRSIYQASGYRVGVFTSPHLQKFNERIAINDKIISDEDLYRSTRYIMDLDSENVLSFFPKIFLIGLHYFKTHQIDALILEVGCGGRLDAINILDADLVIVSSVDLDHQAFLGETREEIAKEKAGLFRFNQKVIFADTYCPKAITEMAHQLQVDLACYGQDYMVLQTGQSWQLHFAEHELNFSCFPKIHLPAMASAILASIILQTQLPVFKPAWDSAIYSAFIPGRQQWIEQDIPILLDVSHNPHAVDLLVKHLDLHAPNGRVHAVFSVLKDKDGQRIVKIFNKLSPLWYTTLLNSERSHQQESLNQMFELNQTTHQFFKTPLQAFQQARQSAKPGDCIVVFGSFILVSEIISQLQQEGAYVF